MPKDRELTPEEQSAIVADVILGEAAGEGPEGMAFVRDVLHTRSVKKKKTLYEVATEPKQFSAYERKDLKEFTKKQPFMLRNLAGILVQEASQPTFKPTYPYTHYVTQSLWNSRKNLPKTHWLHRMRPVQTIGNHVALEEIPSR